MQTEIAKWGNSAAMRIPAALMRESGVAVGTKMDAKFENGSIILTPQKTNMTRAERLEWLLADFAEHGPIEEIPAGPAQGNEVVEW